MNHGTLNSNILGYLDSNTYISSERYEIMGWAFNKSKKISKFILTNNENGEETECRPVTRDDVSSFYGNSNASESGFIYQFDPRSGGQVMSIYAQYSDKTRDLIFEVKVLGDLIDIPKELSSVNGTVFPDLIAVDDFYENPDEIRRIAMEQDFAPSGYHKGSRTKTRLILDGTKTSFERIIGKRIIDWNQAFNGVFQYCTAKDPIVYHADVQSYAAIVFLTPDAPPQTGTTFYRSRINGSWSYPTEEEAKRTGKTVDELSRELFGDPPNFYDGTRWDVVDSLGNRYNRMVMFNSKLIHAASQYFGNDINDSRLFHMFFFECED